MRLLRSTTSSYLRLSAHFRGLSTRLLSNVIQQVVGPAGCAVLHAVEELRFVPFFTHFNRIHYCFFDETLCVFEAHYITPFDIRVMKINVTTYYGSQFSHFMIEPNKSTWKLSVKVRWNLCIRHRIYHYYYKTKLKRKVWKLYSKSIWSIALK